MDFQPSVRRLESIDSQAALHDPLAFVMSIAGLADLVEYPSADSQIVFINHPTLAWEVLQDENFERTTLLKTVLGDSLLAGDGHYWRQQRQLLQGEMSRSQVARFGETIVELVKDLAIRWQASAQAGRTVDLSEEMTELTLKIAMRCLFTTDLGSQKHTLMHAVSIAVCDLGSASWAYFAGTDSLAANRHCIKGAIGAIDRIVYGMIRERRKLAEWPNDLLTLLINHTDPNAIRPLSDKQVRDEVVTMMFAGHESTALILGWTWRLLAAHPESQQRLHEEVDEILPADDSPAETADRLPYARSVLQEVMRLYPPIWLLPRTPKSETRMGDVMMGVGAIAAVCPYALHRWPQVWNDPNSFQPERFSADRVADIPPGAYIPFAAGRHHCLGSHFAMLEATLIVAHLARLFRICPLPRRVDPQAALTLRLDRGLLCQLELRR